MSEIPVKISCPYCQSSKIVKNGVNRNGIHNLLCRQCGRQFQPAYRYKGADPAVRKLIVRMLEKNSGIRDIEAVLEVSRACVRKTLCKHGPEASIRPGHKHYPSVQLDELWSYVASRKKGKYWLLYAYSPAYDEIIGFVCGSRSAATVGRLYRQLQGIEIDEFCTDNWKAFSKVLPADKHKVGKAYTKHIEGVNTCLRASNRRLVRRTTCFSKKKENHRASLNIMFMCRNKTKTSHHTL